MTKNAISREKKPKRIKKHLSWTFGLLFIISALIIVALTLIFIGVFNSNDRRLWRLPAQTIESDGKLRVYRVYVPKNYDQDKQYSLLLLIHGYSDNGRLIGAYTGSATLAENEDIILVLPEGYRTSKFGPKSWNSGICCGEAFQQDLPDSDLLAKITDEVSEKYSINPDKKYVAGFSNGAMMTQKLVMDYPDKFKAFASMGGSIGANDKLIGEPDVAVNGLFINGSKDPTIPVNGGAAKTGFIWVNRETMINSWIVGCEDSEEEQLKDREIVRYSCENNKVIQAELHYELGHRWPGARHKNHKDEIAEGSKHMWEFFESLD